ncbi:MAG TPA: HipA domain-containing protein [Terriglobales bacterium]|nr:HipA domain-containing protein [Terriglobales bacterium]
MGCRALSVPPTRKYESDGGPGMEQILKLLQGSDEPHADQQRFLKANIVFWLLGATDGHAKNYSIFLAPGGRFSMTPFYDVISAQPSVDAKQILLKQFRLAMAVGSKRHWQIRQIASRHFFQTAKKSWCRGKNCQRCNSGAAGFRQSGQWIRWCLACKKVFRSAWRTRSSVGLRGGLSCWRVGGRGLGIWVGLCMMPSETISEAQV